MSKNRRGRTRTYKLYGKRQPDPIIKPDRVMVDHKLAEEMLEASLERRGLLREKPKGSCYDCGKPVTGARRLCGRCAARHAEESQKNK